VSGRDPVRLLDRRSELHPSLRALLERGREELPPPERLAEMARRLGPEFVAPATATATTSSSLLSPVLVGLVLAGLGAAAYWVVAHASEPTAPPAAQRAHTVAVTTPTGTGPTATVWAAGSGAPSPAGVPNEKPPAAPISEPRTAVDRARAPARERSAAAANDPVAELALLDAAQRALHALPQRALTYASLHRARYPHGQFEQEREIIAIEALLQLGRAGAAERRAASFVARFSGSGYAERARQQRERARAAR